jgi:hypothetical protein
MEIYVRTQLILNHSMNVEYYLYIKLSGMVVKLCREVYSSHEHLFKSLVLAFVHVCQCTCCLIHKLEYIIVLHGQVIHQDNVQRLYNMTKNCDY